jgi:hypothetical protein
MLVTSNLNTWDEVKHTIGFQSTQSVSIEQTSDTRRNTGCIAELLTEHAATQKMVDNATICGSSKNQRKTN